MTVIGLGLNPQLADMLRPRRKIRVPVGRSVLTDTDKTYLADQDGAVLLGDTR